MTFKQEGFMINLKTELVGKKREIAKFILEARKSTVLEMSKKTLINKMTIYKWLRIFEESGYIDHCGSAFEITKKGIAEFSKEFPDNGAPLCK
jgi:DeoR/GlpR family transcriptional regulator of sugar metabolism